MCDSTKKLLALIKNNTSINSIKEEMGLTNSQLAYRLHLLKYQGYCINHKYFANGDVTLSLANEVMDLVPCAKIYTKRSETSMRFLVISDLHYFHEYENRIAIDNAFNYCIKNGIHIVFICGDLIDSKKNNSVSVDEQAQTFTQLYPYDKSIIHFCVLGNHDMKTMRKEHIDFKRVIENKRLDIVPINYLEAKVCIKNDKLFLVHPISNMASVYKVEKAGRLSFIGHSHVYKIQERKVYVPSLSNVQVYNQKNFHFFPQALDATLNFNTINGTFNTIVIDQVVMEKCPYMISENIMHINNSKFDTNNLEVRDYPTLERKR